MAAIYCRTIDDPEGSGLGVRRRRADCEVRANGAVPTGRTDDYLATDPSSVHIRCAPAEAHAATRPSATPHVVRADPSIEVARLHRVGARETDIQGLIDGHRHDANTDCGGRGQRCATSTGHERVCG
jgi:hypothetical protein